MKSIVASHRMERDELLEKAFVTRHALKSVIPYMTSKRQGRRLSATGNR